MDGVHGVCMVGPLARHAGGLAGELARLGFTELSARGQLGLAAHLSRWLEAAGLGMTALTTSAVEAYLASRRAGGYTAYLTPKALVPLLGYLRGLGLVPQAQPTAPQGPAEELLERYRSYLLAERGCSPLWRAATLILSARSWCAAPLRAARAWGRYQQVMSRRS